MHSLIYRCETKMNTSDVRLMEMEALFLDSLATKDTLYKLIVHEGKSVMEATHIAYGEQQISALRYIYSLIGLSTLAVEYWNAEIAKVVDYDSHTQYPEIILAMRDKVAGMWDLLGGCDNQTFVFYVRQLLTLRCLRDGGPKNFSADYDIGYLSENLNSICASTSGNDY